MKLSITPRRLLLALFYLVFVVAMLPGCAMDLEIVTIQLEPIGEAVIPVTEVKDARTTTICVEPGMLVKWYNATDADQLITFDAEEKLLFGIGSMKIAAGASTLLQVPGDAPADEGHRYGIVVGDLTASEYRKLIDKINEEAAAKAEEDDPEWIPYGPPALIVCPPGNSPCN